MEPRYNEVLGTLKITLLYQVSHYIRVKKQRNIKSWDQQNNLVIRGFCYITKFHCIKNADAKFVLLLYKCNVHVTEEKKELSIKAYPLQITKWNRYDCRTVICSLHQKLSKDELLFSVLKTSTYLRYMDIDVFLPQAHGLTHVRGRVCGYTMYHHSLKKEYMV